MGQIGRTERKATGKTTLGKDSIVVGFLLVDAVLSCLGVFVVSRLGGPRAAFDGALGKIGGTILTAVAIVCLCVVFAMPRTAATTFELSVAPYLGEGANSFLVPFSILFFVVVYLLTFRKSRVVDIIGKFFTPTLLIGVLVLIVAGIVSPLGEIQPAQTDHVFQEGIRAGYQTMDVLGVAAFSIIILDPAECDRGARVRDHGCCVGEFCGGLFLSAVQEQDLLSDAFDHRLRDRGADLRYWSR